MINLHVFDIETEPLDKDYLLKTFEPAFEADGRLTDPIKIAKSKADAQENYFNKSALYAERGRVLVNGFFDGVKYNVLEGDEKKILSDSWELINSIIVDTPLVGWNIFGFDLPFLKKRSILQGVKMPEGIYKGGYKAWHDNLIDGMREWNCGDKTEYTKLDLVSRALNTGKKNGSGADFAGLYHKDREQAMKYMHNDLDLTYAVAKKMFFA